MADKVQASEFTLEDLKSELAELETGYQNLKFDHATKGLPNPLELRAYRRDIARLKTELRSRELSEMSEEDLANRSKIRTRRKRQKQQSKRSKK